MEDISNEEAQTLMAAFRMGLLDKEDIRITPEHIKNYIPIWDRLGLFSQSKGHEDE